MTAIATDVHHFDLPGYPPGTATHCRRVAAWCEELARALEISPADSAALVEAALVHHQPALVHGSGLGRLIEDMGFSICPEEPSDAEPVSVTTDGILRAFKTRMGAHHPRYARLARILEMADCLDEQLEFAPYEAQNIRRILEGNSGDKDCGAEMHASLLKSLRHASWQDLSAVMPHLPVYPATAVRLYQRLSEDMVNLAALEDVAKADQVLAGKLVKAANTVYYSPRLPIRTVTQAISYIGTTDAKHLLLAASVQPLFASPRLHKLWKHALEAAQVAEKLGALSGGVEPAEAFLLGLLHDVGKLAISLLPSDVNQALERLTSRGCQTSVAELVICGFDHCDAGSEVLRHWKFADEFIAAVQYHHEPERSDSRLAAILYLTEFWTDSEEDLPSNARLSCALSRAGLSMEAFDAARFEMNDAISNL